MTFPCHTYIAWEEAVRETMMDDKFPPGMIEEIERFLADDREPPGLDLYPKVFETQLFFPLQRQAEMRRMIQLARTVKPKIVMEIGADKGGSLYHWCKCLPTVHTVIACEIRGTPYESIFEKVFPQIKFTWFPGSSRDKTLLKYLHNPILKQQVFIDVLFIDGDKGAFLEDFDAYLPLMNPTGVVFMHDINEGGSAMRRAFETIKGRGYRTEDIIDVSDSDAAVARERAGTPPASPHEAWLRHWHGRSCGVGVIWMKGA